MASIWRFRVDRTVGCILDIPSQVRNHSYSVLHVSVFLSSVVGWSFLAGVVVVLVAYALNYPLAKYNIFVSQATSSVGLPDDQAIAGFATKLEGEGLKDEWRERTLPEYSFPEVLWLGCVYTSRHYNLSLTPQQRFSGHNACLTNEIQNSSGA